MKSDSVNRDGMAVLRRTIAIENLLPHPRNYNTHSIQSVEAIAESLQRFGQRREIVVYDRGDGSFYILAGHGVVEAAQLIGLPALEANVMPSDTPESETLGYLAADNELARLSSPDNVLLAEILEEQRNLGLSLDSLGYTDETLDALLATLADEALEDATRTTELNTPRGGNVDESLGVMVTCKNEDEQRRAYTLLINEGYTCRILTL